MPCNVQELIPATQQINAIENRAGEDPMVLEGVTERSGAPQRQRQEISRGAPRGPTRQKEKQRDRIQQRPGDRSSNVKRDPRYCSEPEYCSTLSLRLPFLTDRLVLRDKNERSVCNYIGSTPTSELYEAILRFDFNCCILVRA